jgi:hypothetical protein
LVTEVELFIGSILQEDRSVIELLTADHRFLNERLARHYGIEPVFGPQFRRVTLTESTRRGLLGKGAVLLRTSYGDRTSPVLRGAWVLDKLMGTPPSPPPPDTATDLSTPAGEQPKTVRARLEQHRNKAVCRQCHGVIDPIGLALEISTRSASGVMPIALRRQSTRHGSADWRRDQWSSGIAGATEPARVVRRQSPKADDVRLAASSSISTCRRSAPLSGAPRRQLSLVHDRSRSR